LYGKTELLEVKSQAISVNEMHHPDEKGENWGVEKKGRVAIVPGRGKGRIQRRDRTFGRSVKRDQKQQREEQYISGKFTGPIDLLFSGEKSSGTTRSGQETLRPPKKAGPDHRDGGIF